MTLAEFLKAQREQSRLTQTDMAERAGMQRAHLSEIERGKIALPNADIRRRLAAALGVSHLDLLVAAGEITQAELGSVAGVVERDPTDPRELLIERLRRLRLNEERIITLQGVFDAWETNDRKPKEGG